MLMLARLIKFVDLNGGILHSEFHNKLENSNFLNRKEHLYFVHFYSLLAPFILISINPINPGAKHTEHTSIGIQVKYSQQR